MCASKRGDLLGRVALGGIYGLSKTGKVGVLPCVQYNTKIYDYTITYVSCALEQQARSDIFRLKLTLMMVTMMLTS